MLSIHKLDNGNISLLLRIIIDLTILGGRIEKGGE